MRFVVRPHHRHRDMNLFTVEAETIEEAAMFAARRLNTDRDVRVERVSDQSPGDIAEVGYFQDSEGRGWPFLVARDFTKVVFETPEDLERMTKAMDETKVPYERRNLVTITAELDADQVRSLRFAPGVVKIANEVITQPKIDLDNTDVVAFRDHCSRNFFAIEQHYRCLVHWPAIAVGFFLGRGLDVEKSLEYADTIFGNQEFPS